MGSDPLSDALGLVRAQRVITRGLPADGPWVLRFHPRKCLRVIAAVHGKYWLIRDDQEPLPLDEGELAVSNGAVPFAVASGPTATMQEADEVVITGAAPFPPLGGNEVVGFAAHVQMDRCCEDLVLPALPDVIRVRAADPAADALRYLLDHVFQELVHRRLGSEFAGEQYAQLILVEVLRVALDARDLPKTGWLRLLADATLRPHSP